MEQTPRINAPYLDKFLSAPAVRIIGKVTSLRGDTATIDAKGSITVHLHRDANLVQGNAAEVVGKVQPNLEVRVMQSMDLGPNVDLTIADKVVDVTHRYKEIFYDS